MAESSFRFPAALFQPLVDALPKAYEAVLAEAQGKSEDPYFREMVDAIRRHHVSQAIDRAVLAHHLPFRRQLFHVPFGGIRRLLISDEWNFSMIECYLPAGHMFPEPSQYRDELRRTYNDPLQVSLFDILTGQPNGEKPHHPLVFFAYAGDPPHLKHVIIGIPHPTDPCFLEPQLILTATPVTPETVPETVPHRLPLVKKPGELA